MEIPCRHRSRPPACRRSQRLAADRWYPPTGTSFDDAYAALCDVLPVVRGMSRENMQPLMEGGYPDAETWIEQFASYPELHRDGDALVIEPPRMSPVEHIGFLMRRAEKFFLIDANQIARELQDRADEIYLENGGATDASLHWRARAELTEHLPQGRDIK